MSPIPVPNPTTWSDVLKDLKAEEAAAVLPTLVQFEASLIGKDISQIVESAAAVPQQLAANEISLAPVVLGQILSVVIAKGQAALAPSSTATAPVAKAA